MCLTFHIRVAPFFGMPKRIRIYRKYLCFTKKFFPGSLNLGAKIRCAWNRYTAVQTDLKYPLVTFDEIKWFCAFTKYTTQKFTRKPHFTSMTPLNPFTIKCKKRKRKIKGGDMSRDILEFLWIMLQSSIQALCNI